MARSKVTTAKIAALLKSALKRKKLNSPSYSLRALARDLGVSAPFVSNVVSGKRFLPMERLNDFARILELDVHERELLMRATLEQSFGPAPTDFSSRKSRSNLGVRKTTEVRTKNLLSDWANLAVLEGLTLTPTSNQADDLRTRLGLTSPQFKDAIATLSELGLITKVQDGSYRKNDEHLYVAGGRSRKEVRDLHQMMIAKASAELRNKSAQEDYTRRLINGFTMAVNPSHIERLKIKIIEFMDQISQEASTGPCSEVYQLNLQFFPLTKKGR
jgi:uncharacterized protein (TIGR02147 family)